ncbi:MAG: glycosyltransferase family 2 protein [Giesbergeria sp.]
MPVFNGERYLAPTIEAILGQTFTDFEFVIVNDGSTDGSRDILEQYARQDSRIVIVDQQNGGISRALNAGIDRVIAPYVAPIDQDDISLPHRLEVEVAALEAEPDVVCVGGWYDIIDAQGRYLTTLRVPSDDSDIQRVALAGHSPICHSGCMMRKEAFLKVGGYDPEFDLAQDLDLYLRLGEVGRLQNLETPVLRYRVHAAASSERRCAEQRERARVACERAWNRRGIRGTFEAAELYRPGPSSASQHKFSLQYGWWAFNSRERQTAIVYGLRAIHARPLQSEGWRLLACALLKPFGSRR